MFSDKDFTVEEKLDISITDTKTVTLTRVHDQGKTGLCWDYAASSSVRQSLRIKIGKTMLDKTYLKILSYSSKWSRKG